MPKILIVEDNEENRDALSRRLQRRGFEIVMAADGKVGVAMAQTEKPDLVLMDMNMPELDGWEATRQIRAAAETQKLPVIALTASAYLEDRDGFEVELVAPNGELAGPPERCARSPAPTEEASS